MKIPGRTQVEDVTGAVVLQEQGHASAATTDRYLLGINLLARIDPSKQSSLRLNASP